MNTKRRPVLERFMEKVRVQGDCWIWTAYRMPKGYGRFFIDLERPAEFAHRVAYELFIGPIPPGLDVCHTCDTPSCVSPDHLFLGTNLDNMADAKRKGRPIGRWGHRTACLHGHAFTPENVRMWRGARMCRACAREASRRKRERRREARAA